MREIRTSGLMSGEGKRGDWPSLKPPRLSSTLPAARRQTGHGAETDRPKNARWPHTRRDRTFMLGYPAPVRPSSRPTCNGRRRRRSCRSPRESRHRAQTTDEVDTRVPSKRPCGRSQTSLYNTARSQRARLPTAGAPDDHSAQRLDRAVGERACCRGLAPAHLQPWSQADRCTKIQPGPPGGPGQEEAFGEMT